MKISARNQLKGKIAEVTKGATTSHVLIEIGSGVVVTASITNEAVADLQLKKGDDAWAVIKASDVMIGKYGAFPAGPSSPPPSIVTPAPPRKVTRRLLGCNC